MLKQKIREIAQFRTNVFKKFCFYPLQSSSTETSRRGSFSEGAGGPSKKGIEALKRRDSVQGSSNQGIAPHSNSIAKVKTPKISSTDSRKKLQMKFIQFIFCNFRLILP